jgi:hypothetical protein
MVSSFAKQFRLKYVGFDTPAERMNLIDETFDVLKAAVDRRVAQVGDLIDLAQLFQNLVTDHGGGNFVSARFKFVHDVVDRLFKRHETDRTFVARFRDAAGQFPAVENFMSAIAFDDPQIRSLDFFVGGVTKGTL